MADTRYLKQRRQGWYFSIAVPRALHGKFGSTAAGKPIGQITVSLKTRDLTAAQKARWPLVQQYQQAFERAATGSPLSQAEIDEQAAECFTAMLERLEADAKRGRRVLAEPEREGDDPEVAGLSINIDQFAQAREDGEYEIVADEIAAAQRRTGVTLEPGSPTYVVLAEALLTARIEALDGRMRALQGQPTETPVTFIGAKGINPVTLQPLRSERAFPAIRGRDQAGVKFSEAAALFIAERQRDKGAAFTQQTEKQSEAVFRLFKEYTKDAPLNVITRSIASDFLTEISKLHPHWGRSPVAGKMSLRELLDKFGKGKEQLSNKTLNRYSSSLSSVFKWARKAGKFEGHNPFLEQSRPRARKGTTGWVPYTTDELNKIFSAPQIAFPVSERIEPKKHSVETALAWAPLIALFSGMRSGEICQLRTSDVKEAAGILFFNVANEVEGQSVKSDAGFRRVPVHSALIRCGFRKYWKALPEGQLFPGLKPGGPDGKVNWYFTRRYTDFRRSLGIDRPRVSFHSFRKNLTTVLDNEGEHESAVAALIGHSRGFTFDTYSGGKGLAALRTIVEKVHYPGLRLKHLYS